MAGATARPGSRRGLLLVSQPAPIYRGFLSTREISTNHITLHRTTSVKTPRPSLRSVRGRARHRDSAPTVHIAERYKPYNTNSRNMRHLFFTLLLLSSSVLIAQTGGKNFIDLNYIEVTGKAEMEIVPDDIYIRILLNEKDFKGKTLAEIEKLMYGKLIDLGFDLSKDLALNDLVSNFQYYWFIKADVQLSKEYQLLVHDAKTAGKVFIELQKLGISNASINRVENSKIIDYRREVKIAAIKAAQEKAKELTLAINQDIGKAIYVQEVENPSRALTGSVSNIAIRGYSSSNIYGSRAPEPDIEFEKIKLEYNIIARFELK